MAFGEFGQLMALIDLANQAQYNAANTLIEKKKLKGEQKLASQSVQQQEKLAKLDLDFKYRELATKEKLSTRRDALFKDIALYAGIGIGTLVILIVVGVMFVGAKRESQFEYLVKEQKVEN